MERLTLETDRLRPMERDRPRDKTDTAISESTTEFIPDRQTETDI